MDKDLRTYLIEQCRNYMFSEEIKALEQINLTDRDIKNMKTSKLAEKKMEWVYGIGDKKTEKLVALGKDKLEEQIANRLLKENNGIVNYCPKCEKIARTPKARQCRFCGHKWFDESE